MKAELKKEDGKETLVITIPVTRKASATGKSIIIASSNGNKPTDLIIDGKPLVIGLNAYISAT